VDIDSSRLFLQVIFAGYFCRVFLQGVFAGCFCELLFVLMAGRVDALARSDINPTGATLFRFRNATMKRPKSG
jgi:hypothetical protein